jgi:hypothetical protein
MRLRTRFLIIGISIVIFCIVGPILVLFALGYKFDLDTKTIVKTGTLIVESEPGRANIYLNDEKIHDTTPATIRFLLPKDYNVSIQKDGYQTWTKRLLIESQKATWANLDREFLTLFLNKPTKTEDTAIQAFYKNPDNQSVVLIKNNAAVFRDDTGRDHSLATFGLWTQLAPLNLPDDTMYYLLSANRPAPISAEELPTVSKLRSNGDYTVALIGAELKVYDSRNNLIQSFPDISEFTLDGNNLWLTSGTALSAVDLRSGRQTQIEANLPMPNMRVIRGDGNTFLLGGATLYILNDKPDWIYNNADYAYWFGNSHQLVYGNNHEIFVFSTFTQRNELILRSSSDLFQPIVNPETGYVFFGNEGKIKAVELDGRDHRNIYTIADAQKSFMVNQNGKQIFVIGAASIQTLTIR